MAKINNLPDRQEIFIQEYLKTRNATKAAIKAGYSEKTARVQGSDLLTKPDIKARIEAEMIKLQKKHEIGRDRVVKEAAAIAFSNIKHTFRDGSYEIKTLDELTPQQQRAIQSVEIIATKFGQVIKVRMHSKTQGIDLLSKLLNLYKDNSDGDNSADASQLDELYNQIKATEK
jgi:phage terminase small subunit